MATRQEQFYSEVYAGARQRGLSDAQARLAAAQASLETGYGRSVPGGNMFGIKAGSSWTGPTQNLKTWEDQGGRVNIVDKFRSYANPFDSITDWAGVIDRRFPEASAATSYVDAVDGLNAGQRGGYATDRNYNSKLHAIDNRFGAVAQQNYGLLGRDLPVPSAAPRGVMDVLGSPPSEVAAYADRGLRNGSFPATPAPVERGGMLADAGFDPGRFGDVAPARNQSYDAMVAENRAARVQPQAVAFDSGRFGSATTAADGVQGLREGLLASNAQMAAPQGIVSSAQASPMPSSPSMSGLASQYAQYGAGQAAMQQAMAPSVQAQNLALDVADQRAKLGLPPATQPVQSGYVDPMVSTAQPAQTSAPVQAQPAAAAQPAMAATQPAGQMTGGFGPSISPADAAAISRAYDTRKMLGGILGGVTGGVVLGPVGGLLGGYLGRQTAAKTFYPAAPKGGTSNKGYGRDSQSDYGRQVSKDSKQYDRAVSKGSAGLY